MDIGPPADWVKINVRETVSQFGFSLYLIHVLSMYRNGIFVPFKLVFSKTVCNIHVQKDCFEVYALVPGLLREEVTSLAPYLYHLLFLCRKNLLDIKVHHSVE